MQGSAPVLARGRQEVMKNPTVRFAFAQAEGIQCAHSFPEMFRAL
jgi:hypothetical protein